MYWLMSIDAILRIAFAMAFLFVVVPALAWPWRRDRTWLEWFFWNLGVGITLITLAGQLLTLANLFSFVTLIAGAALVILLGRALSRGRSPWALLRESSEMVFLAFLNIFDRRVNVPRRMRRWYRRWAASLRQKTLSTPGAKTRVAGWLALITITAAFRLYRPLQSANLGFSDTYVHLYLLKLLEDGRQVDPEFGPYPRGMHFLLTAVQDLTNVDPILLMNFFGAIVGVLMTLAVVDVARRLSGRLAAGLLAGFLFATLVGGPTQYFLVGGAFPVTDQRASVLSALPYGELSRTAGEFDIVLRSFHRQTSTLPHELAVTLLFPAVMFLLVYLRGGDRWHLIGFAGCTAAIAAVHPGVLLPLLLMSALALMTLGIFRILAPRTIRGMILAGTVAVMVGSSWMLAFVAYPYVGGKEGASFGRVARTALGYFPVVREMVTDRGEGSAEGGRRSPGEGAWRPFQPSPFLLFTSVVAIGVIGAALRRRGELRSNRIWIAAVFLVFVLLHFASTLGLPAVVDVRRNVQWLTMSMVMVAVVAASEIASLLGSAPKLRYAAAGAAGVLLIGWISRVPLLSEPAIHDRIVNYSGYGGSTLAVLRIGRSFEPYTWTLVSYGQEFPMVLRQGFHLPAIDFLDRYDPSAPVLPVPTPHVFIIVEKSPHRFEVSAWARRFSREELQQRLQTWAYVYQSAHGNLWIFLEDEHVRVYHIERTAEEIERIVRQERQ